MSLETTRRQLQAIKDAIATANATLTEGGNVNLATIQDSVKTVCDQIIKFPQLAGSTEIEELIKTVITDFDSLSQAITSAQQKLNISEKTPSNVYSNNSSHANKDNKDMDKG